MASWLELTFTFTDARNVKTKKKNALELSLYSQRHKNRKNDATFFFLAISFGTKCCRGSSNSRLRSLEFLARRFSSFFLRLARARIRARMVRLSKFTRYIVNYMRYMMVRENIRVSENTVAAHGRERRVNLCKDIHAVQMCAYML